MNKGVGEKRTIRLRLTSFSSSGRFFSITHNALFQRHEATWGNGEWPQLTRAFVQFVRVTLDGQEMGWEILVRLPMWSWERAPSRRFEYGWSQRCLVVSAIAVDPRGFPVPWKWQMPWIAEECFKAEVRHG